MKWSASSTPYNSELIYKVTHTVAHAKNHTNIIDDEYKNPHFIHSVYTPSFPQKFQLTQQSDIPDILPRILPDYKKLEK